jgi:FkbM family methyltransferase
MARNLLIAQGKALARKICPRPALLWLEARYHEKFGETELWLVRHLCRHGRDSLDIGANEGSYLYFMQDHSRMVYAFEPIPWLARRLREKFPEQVVVKNVALSDGAGQATLRIPVVAGEAVTGLSTLATKPRTEMAQFREIDVPVARLDDVYAGAAGFIKIDVEGHEEAVLHGARRTIERSRPRLLVEIEERHAPGAVRRITAFLSGLGYRGYFVHDRCLEPIGKFTPATMQRIEDIAGFGPRTPRRRFARYVNNFLFFSAGEPEQLFRDLTAALERLPR